MKVYMVTYTGFEEGREELLGIFTTEEKAKTAIDENIERIKEESKPYVKIDYNGFNIEEIELDKVLS